MAKKKLGELYRRGTIKPPPSQKAIRAHLNFLNLGNQDADNSLTIDASVCPVCGCGTYKDGICSVCDYGCEN